MSNSYPSFYTFLFGQLLWNRSFFILLLIPDADPGRITELLGPLADLDLRAIREGRVALIRNTMTHLPATSILDLVREIIDATAAWEPQATAAAE